jgi:phenylacetate-CoA ligase
MSVGSLPWPNLGDWSNFEELRRLQSLELPGALSQARRSPFYGSRLRGGERTLEGIALTTKSDLRDAYPFGFLAVPTD